jgi:hypothetical protein
LATEQFALLTAKFLVGRGKARRSRLAARIRKIPLPSSFAMYLNMCLREELQEQLLDAWQATSSLHHCQADVPAVLFRSQEHTPDEPADLGWGVLCPNIRVVNVAGGHKSMLSPPYVDELSVTFIAEVGRTTRDLTSRLVA